MRDLVSRHRVRLIYPVPRDLWIVKLPQNAGGAVSRRKSPRRCGVLDVFAELVSFPELIAHPNFELDVVVTAEETVRRFDGRKGWRRRGWVVAERRLIAVHETLQLRDAAGYAAIMPAGLPPQFATADLAETLGCARHLAQKVAYCLRNGGLIEKVGSRGNAIVYARV
jgi:hypothetical protein